MECVGLAGKVAITASASREGVTGGIQVISSDKHLRAKELQTKMVHDKNVYHVPHGLGEFLRDYSTKSAAPPTMAATARLMVSCDAPLVPVGENCCTVGLPVAAMEVLFMLLHDVEDMSVSMDEVMLGVPVMVWVKTRITVR